MLSMCGFVFCISFMLTVTIDVCDLIPLCPIKNSIPILIQQTLSNYVYKQTSYDLRYVIVGVTQPMTGLVYIHALIVTTENG